MVAELGDVLSRADAYFMSKSPLHDAARAIAGAFDAAGIPYAVAGALALAVHGHARMTTDVDILVRREDLEAFKREWLGRGYVEVTKGLKAVRDTVRNVKIDFLIAGDFPGDGAPKPVAFPDPATQTSTADGYRVVDLRTLLELKLASGMTAPHRPRDLADVIDLVRARKLPLELATDLDPYVRDKFLELWQLAQIEDDY
jgi:hypothetical protein